MKQLSPTILGVMQVHQRLMALADKVEEDALVSGAMPGEFEVVIAFRPSWLGAETVVELA